jgi:hypothetical protein
MSFQGAFINKLNGGLGRVSSSDRTIALVAGTVKGGVAFNTAYKLLDISTAEGLGITAETDNNNNELTHYHLSEMFRLSPESTFWLIPVDKTTTVADFVANVDLKTAIRSIPGVNVLGVAGLTTSVDTALADAITFQSFVDSFASEHLLIDGIFVEGVGEGVQIDIRGYSDLRTIVAPNITYVIAQDPAVAAMSTAYARRSAIGTVLGSVAVRSVHEDIGSVDIETKPRTRRGQENYTLSDATLGYWMSASLSDGKPFSSLTAAEQSILTAKGWMYVGSFADYGGFYWNGCPTSVSITSDYAYFNFNCIWNKAARLIRTTLIPKVRSKVPVDPTTGYLKSTWVSGCEADVLRSLGAMQASGDIEDKDVYINPAQAPSETTPLSVKATVVVGDIVHEFDVDLGMSHISTTY